MLLRSENAVRDANMLVFVTPHQFMEGICKRIAGKISQDTEAISLIKGMEVKMEGPCMISTLIKQQLGIDCCVLMGANIANEIAVEKFSEATVGYKENREIAEKRVQLFNTNYFMVSAACASLEPNYQPPLTLIVVQKRHHTLAYLGHLGTSSGVKVCKPCIEEFCQNITKLCQV